MASGQPVSDALGLAPGEGWDDRTAATVWGWLDDKAEAERDAIRDARRAAGRR